MVFDWAGLIDTLTPWVNLALAEVSEAGGDDTGMTGAVSSQVATVLDVLKVLRTVTSASYFEDGVLVTHTLLEFRDVAE